MPKIVIAGAGIAGSYLYRLLLRRNIDPGEIEIFDPGPKTRCGIAPCCFGTTKQFFSLCEDVGLDPQNYVMHSLDSGYLGSFKLKFQGHAFVIDKPAFIKDLLSGASVLTEPRIDSEPERIIDATGVARAYIGKYDRDVLIHCFQSKVEFPNLPVAKELLHHVGVSWVIPLESSNAHVGTATHTYDLHKMKEINEKLAKGGRTICGCQGYIRGTGPILPLVHGNVWAVGEAGGIVDSLTALGIVPAMVSARLLVDNWDDAAEYQAAIIRKYGWLRQTAQIVNALVERNTLRIWSLSLLKNYTDFIGLQPRAGWLIHPNVIRSLIQFPALIKLYRGMKRT